jgi:hypothetical protein
VWLQQKYPAFAAATIKFNVPPPQNQEPPNHKMSAAKKKAKSQPLGARRTLY